MPAGGGASLGSGRAGARPGRRSCPTGFPGTPPPTHNGSALSLGMQAVGGSAGPCGCDFVALACLGHGKHMPPHVTLTITPTHATMHTYHHNHNYHMSHHHACICYHTHTTTTTTTSHHHRTSHSPSLYIPPCVTITTRHTSHMLRSSPLPRTSHYHV